MFSEPIRANFKDYGHYALATLGYAVLSRSVGSAGVGGCFPGGDGGRSCICAGVAASVVGRESSGRCGSEGERDALEGCDRGRDISGDVGRQLHLDCGSVGTAIHGGGCSGDKAPEEDGQDEVREVVDSRHGLWDDGVSTVPRGKNFLKNRQKKERKRRAKERHHSSGVDSEARRTLEEKWIAENRLAVLRAQQCAEILRQRDLGAAANLRRTRVASQVERNLVNMEKSHSFLKSTGNVPGVSPQGFAETVSGSDPGLSSGTISPNSSISEADVRRMKKEMEDLVAERDKAVGYLREYGIDFQGCLYRDKAEWTDNSENIAILDDLFPDGFLKHVVDEDTGKFVPC